MIISSEKKLDFYIIRPPQVFISYENQQASISTIISVQRPLLIVLIYIIIYFRYWAFSFERKNGQEGRQVSNNKGDIAGQVWLHRFQHKSSKNEFVYVSIYLSIYELNFREISLTLSFQKLITIRSLVQSCFKTA